MGFPSLKHIRNLDKTGLRQYFSEFDHMKKNDPQQTVENSPPGIVELYDVIEHFFI